MAKSANWKVGNTKEISVGIPEVDFIYQAINEQFKINARLWQVYMVVDITKCKRAGYTIIGINASKSLVYQWILVITDGSVLVISPTIALIKDQINHNSLYHYDGNADV